MDSGATHHITPHRSDFTDYTPATGTVRLGDKSTADQIGVGTAVFISPNKERISLSNVLHVPSVHTRFLSTGAICDKNAEITFTKEGFKIYLDQKCVASGYRNNKLYWLDGTAASLNAHNSSAATLHTWHQRMGHMSHFALEKYGPIALKGCIQVEYDLLHTCRGAIKTKVKVAPLPEISTPQTRHNTQI